MPQTTLFPSQGPADIGVVCPRCRGTSFSTAWQTFSNGTRHLKMTCAVCGKFMRYVKQTPQALAEAVKQADPAWYYEPRPADAHEKEMAPPPSSWEWVGFVRLADGVWRPVALAPTLAGCWNALLTFPKKAELLCVPSEPAPRR